MFTNIIADWYQHKGKKILLWILIVLLYIGILASVVLTIIGCVYFNSIKEGSLVLLTIIADIVAIFIILFVIGCAKGEIQIFESIHYMIKSKSRLASNIGKTNTVSANNQMKQTITSQTNSQRSVPAKPKVNPTLSIKPTKRVIAKTDKPWTCKYCGYVNPGSLTECENCFREKTSE